MINMAALNEEKITKIVGDAVDKLALAISKSFDELKKESDKEHSKLALAMTVATRRLLSSSWTTCSRSSRSASR